MGEKTAPPLQSRWGCGIIQIKKALSGKRSAPFREVITKMTARVEPGSHFLLLKILYAISNAPKPTVASNVSRAKVSKSVIEHPKVYSCKQYYSPAVAISAGLWYNINEESAAKQTVSASPTCQLQEMTARLQSGGHFLLLKIFHAISKMPKLTVASNVSRAKVSKSVMKHPPLSQWSVGG